MATYRGPVDWRLTRDRDGHRLYELFSLIEASNNLPAKSLDDPSVIINAAGLPVIGSLWSDLSFIKGADDWAFCLPDTEVTPYAVTQGEAPQFYVVKNVFSTEPLFRCQDESIENPLNEPHELSGSWVNKKIIPHQDRDGKPYRSSPGTPLIGPQTEIDDADWEIVIGFNSVSIPLALVNSLRHHLNDSVLWGLAAQKVKFSKYSFVRRLYGLCNFYYHNIMHFSIRDDWTQNLADVGYAELKDGGDAETADDWVVSKDPHGENRGLMRLDTSGKVIVNDAQTPNTIVREPYPTGNLLLLGIPNTL